MIRVSLSYLVLIYLLLMLGPIGCVWLMNEWRRHRRERAAFQHVLRCGACGFEFADASGEVLSRCPRCTALNERTRLGRL